jgi:hypothetical protein
MRCARDLDQVDALWMTGGAGSGSDDGLAGTWALQGSTWKQVLVDPPGRAASALAYDPGRDVIVLNGGNSSLNCAPHRDETRVVPEVAASSVGTCANRRASSTVVPALVNLLDEWRCVRQG